MPDGLCKGRIRPVNAVIARSRSEAHWSRAAHEADFSICGPPEMPSFETLAPSLVHIAALLSVAAMFFSSQLLLRWFLLAGTVLNAVYFVAVPTEILWGPVFWSGVMFVVNGAMIGLLVLDRTMFGLSAGEVELYRAFGVFSPGAFRRLMRSARWHEAGSDEVLTVGGEPVSRLYFVLSGPVRVARADGERRLDGGAFIGEIAFLRRSPASATVTVGPGARYVAWEREALTRLIAQRPAIGTALATLLNAALAAKVAAGGAPQSASGLALA